MHEICPEERIRWLPVLLDAYAMARTGAVLPLSPMEKERDAAQAVQPVHAQIIILYRYGREAVTVMEEVDAGKS